MVACRETSGGHLRSLLWRHASGRCPLDVDDVELAGGVLPEGADPQSGLDGPQPRPGVARVTNQSPDPAAAIIGEQVDAVQLRHRGSPRDIAAGDDTALIPVEPGDGRHELVAAAFGAARSPLHQIPAVVLATRTRCRLVVDFLVRRRPDVPDPQIARDPIETEAPGVAQPKRPDLGAPPGWSTKGLSGGIAYLRAGHWTPIDVDAQDLAEQGAQILAILTVATAPITEPDVEVAILRPKEEQTTIVVGRRLVDGQDDLGARRVSAIRSSVATWYRATTVSPLVSV